MEGGALQLARSSFQGHRMRAADESSGPARRVPAAAASEERSQEPAFMWHQFAFSTLSAFSTSFKMALDSLAEESGQMHAQLAEDVGDIFRDESTRERRVALRRQAVCRMLHLDLARAMTSWAEHWAEGTRLRECERRLQMQFESRELARHVRVWSFATDQWRTDRKLARSFAKSRNHKDLARSWCALALYALEHKTAVAAAGSLAKSRSRKDLARSWCALALHALEHKTAVAAAGSLVKSRSRKDLARSWCALALHALEHKTAVAAAAVFDRRGRLSIMWLRWDIWRGIACQLATASRAVQIMVNARLTRKFIEWRASLAMRRTHRLANIRRKWTMAALSESQLKKRRLQRGLHAWRAVWPPRARPAAPPTPTLGGNPLDGNPLDGNPLDGNPLDDRLDGFLDALLDDQPDHPEMMGRGPDEERHVEPRRLGGSPDYPTLAEGHAAVADSGRASPASSDSASSASSAGSSFTSHSSGNTSTGNTSITSLSSSSVASEHSSVRQSTPRLQLPPQAAQATQSIAASTAANASTTTLTPTTQMVGGLYGPLGPERRAQGQTQDGEVDEGRGVWGKEWQAAASPPSSRHPLPAHPPTTPLAHSAAAESSSLHLHESRRSSQLGSRLGSRLGSELSLSWMGSASWLGGSGTESHPPSRTALSSRSMSFARSTSRPTSRPVSRPTSRPVSRPTSRPTSFRLPFRMAYESAYRSDDSCSVAGGFHPLDTPSTQLCRSWTVTLTPPPGSK